MAEASAVEYRECPACTELRYHQGGSPGDRDDHWHCDGCGFWGRGEGCFPACELASPPSGDVRLCRHVAALALDCICGDRIPGEVTTGTCQACPVPALVEAVRAAEKALPSRGFVEGHEDELPEIMAAFRAGDAALARLDALRAERGRDG